MDLESRLVIIAALLDDVTDELELLRQECLHYGPPLRCKYNGGHPIRLCGLCDTEVPW